MRTQTVLEGYLSYWEDTMFILNIYQKLAGLPSTSAIEQAEQFRQVLLHAYGPKQPDLTQFYFDNKLPWGDDSTLLDYGKQVSTSPFEVFDWTLSSRRVFRLGTDMQSAFEHISVADIPMDQVMWPFDSFLLELATPIVVATERGTRYESRNILVSQPFRYIAEYRDSIMGDRPVVNIALISDEYSRYKPIDKETKRVALASAKSSHHIRAAKFLHNRGAKYLKNGHLYCHELLLIPISQDLSAQDLFSAEGITDPVGQSILRMVLNLCLYLEAMGGKEGVLHHTPPHRRLQGQPRNVITDCTQVCEVTNVHSLRSLAAKGHHHTGGSHEITEWYWRRRHARRPPGLGHDPSVPKSVRVRPTLVRADLMKPGELPGGAVTKI